MSNTDDERHLILAHPTVFGAEMLGPVAAKTLPTKDTPEEKLAVTLMELLDRCREEDKHECNLINHRMSWLMTSQSLFLTAFVIAQAHPIPAWRFFVGLVLGSVSIYVLHTLSSAIRQAEIIIARWHARERDIQRKVESIGSEYKHLLAHWCRRWTYSGQFRNDNDKHLDKQMRQALRKEEDDPQHEKAMKFARTVKQIFYPIWISMAAFSFYLNIYLPLQSERPQTGWRQVFYPTSQPR